MALYGDNNTEFFHASAVARKRRNSINSLLTDEGIRLTEDHEIRKNFVSFFRSIYTKGARRNLESSFGTYILNSLPKIPLEAHKYLTQVPTDQEILNFLMELGPNKSPGPDGFNAKTIQD